MTRAVRRRRSYFAQRNVLAWERPGIMRKHIYTGAMGNVWAHLISGIFFVYFGSQIGMTELQWGTMAGISSWLIAAQLFSARLTERTGQRKRTWFWLAMTDRVLRFVGVAVALWAWNGGSSFAPAILMIAISVANLAGAMGSPPWLSWLADIIPEDEHGTFWGRRSLWISIATMLAVVPAGLVTDRIAPESRLAATVGVLAVATLIGCLDLLIHGTIPEPLAAKASSPPRPRDLTDPFADPAFRPWLVFNAVWTFAMTLGGALATIYFVDQLGISENFLGGTVVLTSFTLFGVMAASRPSGRLVDRYGPRIVLIGGHLLWSFLPFFWFFASPTTALFFLAVASVFGGGGAEAATNAATKLILRAPPAAKRATYSAVSATVGSIAGGLGALAAGAILHLVTTYAPEAFLVRWGDGYRILFAASFLLRLLSTLAILPRTPRVRRPPAPAVPV